MKSFRIDVVFSGEKQPLLIAPKKSEGEKSYRIVKDGVEICTLKPNRDMGWEVNRTPLNADELNSIGNQIKGT